MNLFFLIISLMSHPRTEVAKSFQMGFPDKYFRLWSCQLSAPNTQLFHRSPLRTTHRYTGGLCYKASLLPMEIWRSHTLSPVMKHSSFNFHRLPTPLKRLHISLSVDILLFTALPLVTFRSCPAFPYTHNAAMCIFKCTTLYPEFCVPTCLWSLRTCVTAPSWFENTS